MPYIDLTHTFDKHISVYPGDTAPLVQSITTVSKDGYASKQIAFTSHQGTHIDAMSHMQENGKTLTDLPLEKFSGSALTIDVRSYAAQQIPKMIFEKQAALIASADFILLYSGWDQYWGTAAFEKDFPTISREAMEYLCGFNLKGIGMDCFSPDPVNSPDYAIHHLAFDAEMVLIENLRQLQFLPDNKLVQFFCFPMKIADADGAPVRAVALV
jgi:arylformamidase